MIYDQRAKLLQNNWDDYVCCNGVCFGDKVPMQHDCPQCCMWCEALCCCTCAVHGNRNYLLEKYWIKDSYMEKCFLHCCGGPNMVQCKFMNPIVCLRCICENLPIIGDCVKGCPACDKGCPENCQVTLCVDPVSACFLTQQAVEMERRGYPDDLIYRQNPYSNEAGGAPAAVAPTYVAAPAPGYQSAPPPSH